MQSDMTLAQLRTFAAVARHGSVRGAARELGVSEPAVSEAVGALRRHLGADLYVRSGRGIALTPGGERLALVAGELLGLAERARRSVEVESPRLLRVAAASAVAEHVAPPLLDAFTDRAPDLDVALEEHPPGAFAALLERRRADVALGPRPPRDGAPGLAAVPFLRYRLVLVAGLAHPLTGVRDVAPAALARERWLVGPAGAEPGTPTGAYLRRHGIAPADVRVHPSEGAALAAVAAGAGIMLVLLHAVLDELHRRALARLDVRGTPFADRWHATVLGGDRAPAAAVALQRFAASPEAMQAIAARGHGVPATRARHPVHVTLWSSVRGG